MYTISIDHGPYQTQLDVLATLKKNSCICWRVTFIFMNDKVRPLFLHRVKR